MAFCQHQCQLHLTDERASMSSSAYIGGGTDWRMVARK
jgi:hypothetical protein